MQFVPIPNLEQTYGIEGNGTAPYSPELEWPKYVLNIGIDFFNSNWSYLSLVDDSMNHRPL